MPRLKYPILYIIIVVCFITDCKTGSPDPQPLVTPIISGGESGLYLVGGTYSPAVDTFAVPVLWHGGGMLNLAAKKTYSPVITTQGKDIYAAYNDATGSVYSKNGLVIGNLSVPTNMRSYVTGIALIGPDVYISGSLLTGSNGYPSIPVYWKNGTLNYLSYPTPLGLFDQWNTSGIAVSGSDVYISGSHSTGAAYWKNGVITILPNGVYAKGITVSGTDVYVAGVLHTTPVSFVDQAGYWKNGVAVFMPNPNNINQTALAIAVQGTDVYVAGYNYGSGYNTNAVYWKNGTLNTLSKISGSGVRVSAIFIDPSNNVYMAGAEGVSGQNYSVAAYWLNGAETLLSTQSSVSSGLVYVQ